MRYFFLIFVLAIAKTYLASDCDKPLKIYIFCESNNKGLGKDRHILIESLQALNCEVEAFSAAAQGPTSLADINIFVQQIETKYLNLAKLNWFIPNPEWYLDDVQLLKCLDLVLCRTKEVERIFQNLRIPTYFLSFTSEDHYLQNIAKNPDYFLHVAGSSSQKGTTAIKKTWSSHSSFPHLTILKYKAKNLSTKNLNIINSYINHEELLQLQNQSMVHLCLSETEGFGHSIMEAMSVGAVVITTKAPPMNEFIQDERCLVPFKMFSIQRLATNYYVDKKDIAKTVKSIQKLSKKELKEIGNLNRRRYLEICQQFKINLKNLIEDTKEKTLSYE